MDIEKIKKQRQNNEAFKRISILCNLRDELITGIRNYNPYENERLTPLYNDLFDKMEKPYLKKLGS